MSDDSLCEYAHFADLMLSWLVYLLYEGTIGAVVATRSRGMNVADSLPLLVFGDECELDETESELDGTHRRMLAESQ